MPESSQDQPPIPIEGKIGKLENVFIHYTKPESLFQIIEWGLISKKLADRARLPYHHSNIPKVQQAEGFEWISAWNPQVSEYVQNNALQDELLIITRKIPNRSKPASSEDAFQGEWLIKNRVRPKDILGVWISEDFYHETVGQVVVGLESKIVKPWISLLSQQDNDLSEWWRVHSIQKRKDYASARVTEGMSEVGIDNLVTDAIFPQFIKRWLNEKFGFDVTEARVGDLLFASSRQLTYPVGILRHSNGLELIPINKYRENDTSRRNDPFWEMMKEDMGWID